MFFHAEGIHASVPEDSVQRLDEVVVRDRTPPHAARIDSTGRLSLSTASLRQGQRTMGEADALHALASMPGYATAGDYGSGVSAGGDDLSTTLYTIDGATVFHPFHFGGMFSAFNSSHLSTVAVDRIRHPVGSSKRLGAHVGGRTPDYVPSATNGIINIGMLATGVSVAVPIRDASVLRASARTSHINAIYGSLLDYDGSSIRYAFEDANLTFLHQFDAMNSLKASVFVNSDRLRYGDGSLSVDTRLRWSNLAAIASWRHQDASVAWHQDMAYSQYSSDMHTGLATVRLNLASGVRQLAAAGAAELTDRSAHFGYRMELTRFYPQHPSFTGAGYGAPNVSSVNAWLGVISGGKEWKAGKMMLSARADMALYRSCGSTYAAADPSVEISGASGGTWTLRAGLSSQFIHQVGLSDIGFASDFLLPSARGLSPQRAFGVDFVYRRSPTPWLDITVNAFAKRVIHSPQYMGGILDILDDAYDPFISVILTDGFNTGADALVSFSAGALSGWAGYGLAICRRKAGGRWTSSANEPLHSLKAMAECSVASSLKLSTSFVLASGRPYTPVEAIYIIGGNVMMEYGLLNSARLPAYHRLDVSATYTFPSFHIGGGQVRNYANFSVINAYGHHNVEMQYFTYDSAAHTVRLRRVCSIYRFLPSISYTIEF